MSRARATLTGGLAVLLWSLLALLTVRAAPVPPLMLNALTFGLATIVGLGWGLASGTLPALRRIPLHAHLFGIAGLFGYHLLYFTALRLAPPAQASLVAYLWPLLIVLLSGLLPGERLTRAHLAGASVAFGGAALVVLGRGAGAAGPGAALGLGLAAGAAVTWAAYSVGSRALGRVPTVGVTVSCAGTALLSLIGHLAWEETAWPDAGGWLAVLALGLGPVGAAFFLWDVGMKRGDIQALGVAAYAAPLLSTLALVAAGEARPTWRLGLAALLIVGGALLATSRGNARGSPRRVGPTPPAPP